MQNTVNTTGYTYDNQGRPTGISYPSSVAVGYAYDHGKLAAVTSTMGGVTTNIATGFHYQPFGAATEWTYGNGLKHSASFDQDGRLTHLGASNGATVRQNLGYSYNQGDEITAITNGIDATQNRAYAYDTGGRLWQDTQSHLVWSFDANGNHNRFTSPSGQTDYVIEPASNRVSSYTTQAGTHTAYQYDARSNRTVAQEQPGITQNYTYNAFNRLDTVTTSTTVNGLLYNAQDQRVAKGGTGGQTQYIYVGDQLAAEHGPAGWKSYIWAGPELVGVVRDNGTTYFVHNDHLGRPEVVTGASQEMAWRANNGPYGRTVVLDHIGGLSLGFPGQYQDVETGLWINGFRTYDESIGRYLEPDPAGLKGSLNTYSYVDGSPVSNIDPFGTTKWHVSMFGASSPIAYGFGFTYMSFHATARIPGTDCGVYVDGHVKGADGGISPGLGFSGSTFDMDDGLDYFDPTALSGQFSSMGAQLLIGAGPSYSATRLGKGYSDWGWGFSGGIAFGSTAASGISTITSTTYFSLRPNDH